MSGKLKLLRREIITFSNYEQEFRNNFNAIERFLLAVIFKIQIFN